VTEDSRIAEEGLVAMESMDIRPTDTDPPNAHQDFAGPGSCRPVRGSQYQAARFFESYGLHG